MESGAMNEGLTISAPDNLKDPRTAMLLSAIPGLFGIAGLGQVYAGRLLRATLIEIGYVVVILYMVGGFIFGHPDMGILTAALWFMFWFLQTRDARDVTREHNLFQHLNVIWYGDDRKEKGRKFDIGNVDLVMPSPPNEYNTKSIKEMCIIVAIFGIPVCFLYWSTTPIFISCGMAILCWVLNWYSRFYRMPKEVAFGEKGIELRFLNGKKTQVPWMAISVMWLSYDVKITIPQANIFYLGKMVKHLRYNVAVEVVRRYEEATGRTMRILSDQEMNKYQKTMRAENERMREEFFPRINESGNTS